jgi:hypothetical protein
VQRGQIRACACAADEGALVGCRATGVIGRYVTLAFSSSAHGQR